tara:strand:- start:437 stop:1822 length:1386 start_codon:yes stop_codon:yes gene_type:complete
MDVTSQQNFIPSAKFAGPKPGYLFREDKQGLGYYRDSNPNSKPNNSDRSDSNDGSSPELTEFERPDKDLLCGSKANDESFKVSLACLLGPCLLLGYAISKILSQDPAASGFASELADGTSAHELFTKTTCNVTEVRRRAFDQSICLDWACGNDYESWDPSDSRSEYDEDFSWGGSNLNPSSSNSWYETPSSSTFWYDLAPAISNQRRLQDSSDDTGPKCSEQTGCSKRRYYCFDEFSIDYTNGDYDNNNFTEVGIWRRKGGVEGEGARYPLDCEVSDANAVVIDVKATASIDCWMLKDGVSEKTCDEDDDDWMCGTDVIEVDGYAMEKFPPYFRDYANCDYDRDDDKEGQCITLDVILQAETMKRLRFYEEGLSGAWTRLIVAIVLILIALCYTVAVRIESIRKATEQRDNGIIYNGCCSPSDASRAITRDENEEISSALPSSQEMVPLGGDGGTPVVHTL